MAIKKTAADEVAESPEAARFNFNSLNTLAVVSLATAVTGFGAVAGIITGHFALAQLKQQPKSGRGLAIAGLVVGYATIAFWVIGALAHAGGDNDEAGSAECRASRGELI